MSYVIVVSDRVDGVKQRCLQVASVKSKVSLLHCQKLKVQKPCIKCFSCTLFSFCVGPHDKKKVQWINIIIAVRPFSWIVGSANDFGRDVSDSVLSVAISLLTVFTDSKAYVKFFQWTEIGKESSLPWKWHLLVSTGVDCEFLKFIVPVQNSEYYSTVGANRTPSNTRD